MRSIVIAVLAGGIALQAGAARAQVGKDIAPGNPDLAPREIPQNGDVGVADIERYEALEQGQRLRAVGEDCGVFREFGERAAIRCRSPELAVVGRVCAARITRFPDGRLECRIEPFTELNELCTVYMLRQDYGEIRCRRAALDPDELEAVRGD